MSPTARRSRRRRLLPLLLAPLVAALVLGSAGVAASSTGGDPDPAKPTIVLVHGAFADASGWTAVTRSLQADGFEVVAPANPLRGLDTDVAYLRSVLDTIEGPIVLVGHSYGGMVMTNAAVGHPGVEALVYTAAFAPDTGDTVGGLTAKFPGSGLTPDNLVIRPYDGGLDGYISADAFHEVFADDLSEATARVMAATQRPASLATLEQPSGEPAWKTIPSWYLVATADHTIPPALQRFMAERAGATTTEVWSSHVVMVSHAQAVTKIILEAVDGVS